MYSDPNAFKSANESKRNRLNKKKTFFPKTLNAHVAPSNP